MNFNLASMNASAGYLEDTTTEVLKKYQILSIYSKIMLSLVIFIVCFIGVPLNGIVIWLLGFEIKRNPFTVLILNLAIADFGFLISVTIFCIGHFIYISQSQILWEILSSLFSVTYINGLFLLTAISIDRCVAVLFPIWHRCSRPKYLSSAVCAFLWIFSLLLIGMDYIMRYLFLYNKIWDIHWVVTAVLCLPLITISTMILVIKICLQSKQMKRRRLFVMILITLLCFFIFTLPLYIILFLIHFVKNNSFDPKELNYFLTLTASLNSNINPVIYFLVGRKKRARTRESMKDIFQRLFSEDEPPEI